MASSLSIYADEHEERNNRISVNFGENATKTEPTPPPETDPIEDVQADPGSVSCSSSGSRSSDTKICGLDLCKNVEQAGTVIPQEPVESTPEPMIILPSELVMTLEPTLNILEPTIASEVMPDRKV